MARARSGRYAIEFRERGWSIFWIFQCFCAVVPLTIADVLTLRARSWFYRQVQDVCDWLESMEMREYAPTFKKNKVDGATLLMLNDNDLRELGVGVRLAHAFSLFCFVLGCC